jgi:hypothetical protein
MGLALGGQAQSTMRDLIGMSFIPMCTVMGLFLVFFSLLIFLVVWGGFGWSSLSASVFSLKQSIGDVASGCLLR